MNLEIQQKKEKGITLIALVITIIVLMILAGITIATLTGDNGLLTKTNEAKFKTEIKQYNEELILAIAEDTVNNLGDRESKFNIRRNNYADEKVFTEAMKTKIPSFDIKYADKLEIKEDELVYIGMKEDERKWTEESKITVAPKLTINYLDKSGNKLVESYTIIVPNKTYSLAVPKLEGYMPYQNTIEGNIGEDTEVNVEYYKICNELEFVGLDSSYSETTNEDSIVYYKVIGVGNCNDPYVAIPEEYNGRRVTQIKEKSFANNTFIKGIIIPSSIEKVGDEAFYGSTGLKEVSINSKKVSYIMFCNCTNLEKVTIGENVEMLSNRSFDRCSKLHDFTIYSESGVLFNQASGEFKACTSLEEFKVNDDNNTYKVLDGVLYSKDGTRLIRYPTAKKGAEYEILPNVKSLAFSAFHNNIKLEKINIPSTIAEIEDEVFYGSTALKEVSINSKKVSYIMFCNCTNLEKVTIGENVEMLSNRSFDRCSKLHDFTIYSESGVLFNQASGEFKACTSLEEFKVNDDNNTYKVLDGVLYSKDGTRLIRYPTAKKGAEYEILPNVKSLAFSAFHNNIKLEKINIPSTIAEIEDEVFYGSTALKEVSINSKKVSYIMFCGCTNLEKIIIGENVRTIGSRALDRCTKLNKIDYLGNMESWNNIEKGSLWKQNTEISQVICSDGTLNL